MPSRPQAKAKLQSKLAIGFLWLALLLLSACATAPLMNKPAAAVHTQACQALLSRLEFLIYKHHSRDAQYAVIPGLPLFRLDRVLEERLSAANTAAERRRWLQRAADYGVTSSLIEVANLPSKAQTGLAAEASLQGQLSSCAATATERLLSDSAWNDLKQKARVASEYFAGRRLLGLYPLTNIGMQAGIADWQADTRWLYNQPIVNVSDYQLWQPDVVLSPIGDIAFDSLAMPTPTAQQWQALAARFAPQWMLPQGADYDQPGTPLAGGEFKAAPVVYWQPSVGKVHGRFLPQISYTIWFSKRPASGLVDILAGKLDGVVWRVSLSPNENGEWSPLIYDSIHPCGCYHLFFPTPRLPHCATDLSRESAFVPQAAPQRPFAIWLQSATHYLQQLKPAPAEAEPKFYQLRPLDELRYAAEAGERLYGSRGLVPGTDRLERFILWTSGLVSPGAMRQWGNQATAFSGERYFDEPDLFDKEFCAADAESHHFGGQLP